MSDELNDKQKKLLDKIKNEAHLIGHLVGFEKLTPLHSKWIKNMLLCKDIYVLKAHRNSYKSTCMILVIALIMILYPNKTIIFMRKTEDLVKEVVEKVSKILHSETFQYFAQILHGTTFQFTKDTTLEINTTLKTSLGGKSQLIAMGSSSAVTSMHSDIVIVDDLCDIRDRRSASERDRIKNVWMELQNVVNRDGCRIAIGTTWHKADVFSLMPQADVYTCYETGLMSDEEIEKAKSSMTPALFAANYELKFLASEDALFTDIRYEKDLKLPDDVTAKSLIQNGICHVDASYGGSDTTAFTIMKKLQDGRIIAFGKVWNKHVKQCMNEIITYKNYYLAGTLYMENNGDKGYLAQDFRERDIRCITYHESMNKDTKISTYLYGSWQNIYWLNGTDDEYINQIMDYVENSDVLVDAPDSAACCCRIFEKNRVRCIEGVMV